MSLYEKNVLKKWISCLALFLIFKYPLSKLLGKHDMEYIFIFTLFTVISVIQILNFRIKNKEKKDSDNRL